MFPEILWWKAYASGWVMNVWDCVGEVAPADDELWEALDFENSFEYVEVGNFRIPIPKQFAGRLTDRLLRKIEGWCWEVLRFWGSGINISGAYPIPMDMMQELEAMLHKYSKPEAELDLGALRRWMP